MAKIATYISASDEQVNWGGCADPRGLLEEGKQYAIQRVDVRSWHTKIYLEEFPGKGFNSVCFSISEGE